MVERFLAKTNFASQEDFIKNLKINVPENFNFGYDVVDAWAAEQPDKNALLWTNDRGESRQFSFADMKRYTDGFLLPEPRHRSRRYGDADSETPLRVLVQHHRLA